MNCDVTLTAEEFKTIHNTLWQLQYGDKPDVQACAEAIRSALKGAYIQEQDSFDRNSEHFRQVRKELGLKSTWSIYEVPNLSERHPFVGATKVVYKDHWGNRDIEVAINGSTWAALYVAADAAIRDSGDEHHSFIEEFKQSSINPEYLFLSTGS